MLLDDAAPPFPCQDLQRGKTILMTLTDFFSGKTFKHFFFAFLLQQIFAN